MFMLDNKLCMVMTSTGSKFMLLQGNKIVYVNVDRLFGLLATGNIKTYRWAHEIIAGFYED